MLAMKRRMKTQVFYFDFLDEVAVNDDGFA